MTTDIGIYIHVPFCGGKCPYCDFYSLSGSEELMDAYVLAVIRELELYKDKKIRAKTVYFGGGTPSLLGAKRLCNILNSSANCFSLNSDAEITLEANPVSVDEEFFRAVQAGGFNRLSMGMQSANEDELKLLGRKHSAQDVVNAVKAARRAGFENISLDLMLGLPGGNTEKLRRSIDFAAGLSAEHISAYILKVEEGTPFASMKLKLPNDDETAELYLFTVEELKRHGYFQYEISNFSRPEKESRHNLIYWRCEEYLGFGPAAHSFYNGRRFFYPRSLSGFISGTDTTDDGEGGGFEEFAMLNLRLTRGLRLSDCTERFGEAGREAFCRAEKNAEGPGMSTFLTVGSGRIGLTPAGFLVSNAVILKVIS